MNEDYKDLITYSNVPSGITGLKFTSVNLLDGDVIPELGEIVLEKSTNKFYIGDGKTQLTSLTPVQFPDYSGIYELNSEIEFNGMFNNPSFPKYIEVEVIKSRICNDEFCPYHCKDKSCREKDSCLIKVLELE